MLNQTITQILSDPTYDPPEAILSLNLSGNLWSILRQLLKEVCVAFAVGEAKLVLPIFEAEFPDDDRPRKAIEAVEEWLRDPSVAAARAARAANAAANAAAVAAAVASSAAASSARDAAYYAVYAVYAARDADSAYAAYYAAYYADAAAAAAYAAARHKDLYVDQFDRLFKVLKQYEVKI